MTAVAIVGGGPAGCYTAQALRKRLPDAEIAVFDRLPVPFGLLRYGVAADHQGTKKVAAQFEKLFERGGVEFRGGVPVGNGASGELTLEKLRDAFDAVVLATGLARDRALDIAADAGEHLLGAGRLTRALNSHPDEAEAMPRVGRSVAVIGAGNIAADLVRLLMRSPGEWEGSDMDSRLLDEIVPEPVERIDVIVRGTAAQARWDAAMVRDLADLSRPGFEIADGRIGDADEPRADAVAQLVAERPLGDATVSFHFESEVGAIETAGDGEPVVLEVATRAGRSMRLPVDTIVTAIGFEPEGEILPERVYAAGWLATGPRGTIPNQRALAQDLARRIAGELESTSMRPNGAARRGLGDPALETALAGAIDYAGWKLVDEAERSAAQTGRVRRKLASYRDIEAVTKPITIQGASR